MGKSYTDSLYKYKESEKDQNGVEIKVPEYGLKDLLYDFMMGGIKPLILFSIGVALITVILYSSIFLFFFLLFYSWTILLSFLMVIGSHIGPSSYNIQRATSIKSRTTVNMSKTQGERHSKTDKRNVNIPKSSRRVFSAWMVIYSLSMILIAGGVISF